MDRRACWICRCQWIGEGQAVRRGLLYCKSSQTKQHPMTTYLISRHRNILLHSDGRISSLRTHTRLWKWSPASSTSSVIPSCPLLRLINLVLGPKMLPSCDGRTNGRVRWRGAWTLTGGSSLLITLNSPMEAQQRVPRLTAPCPSPLRISCTFYAPKPHFFTHSQDRYSAEDDEAIDRYHRGAGM